MVSTILSTRRPHLSVPHSAGGGQAAMLQLQPHLPEYVIVGNTSSRSFGSRFGGREAEAEVAVVVVVVVAFGVAVVVSAVLLCC